MTTPSSRRWSWWQWPTILSLDAPAVALLWQWMIGRAAHARPDAPQAWVLGSSVWLSYAADRWFETWRLAPGKILTARHRFYGKARWPVAVVWIGVLGADLAVSLTQLSRADLLGGLALLVPVLLYLLSHQLVHRHLRWRAPKEICVAALFGGGVGVFVLDRPGADSSSAAVPLALFILLCFSNCLLISRWERDVDRSHGQTSLALQSRKAGTLARILPWCLAALAGSAAAAAGGWTRTALECAAASGALLGAVDAAEGRFGRAMARVLADAALATPAIALVAGWLR